MSTLLSQLILYRNILREIEYAEMDGNLALLANAIDALGGGNGSISLDSPEFTGTPKAPTAAPGTNTTQLATTAFTTAAVADKQTADPTLTALAAITTAADKLIYATGSDTFNTTSLTPFARSLLDDADATAARTTLGISGSSSGGGGFKNAVINGTFNINQRSVVSPVTLAAGVYGHDRWKAGTGGCTYSFSTSENKTTVTITAGTLLQVIEGVNLQSGTYTLSWEGTAQGRIGSGSYGASGVTATVTGGVNTSIEFNAGTVSKVQFECGSSATAFEFRPYTMEFALCARYAQWVGANWSGMEETATTFSVSISYSTPMRAAGALTSLASTISTRVAGADKTMTGCTITSSSTSTTGAWILITTTATGGTAGRPVVSKAPAGIVFVSCEM